MYSIITQSGEERIQCVPKFTTSQIRYGGSLTHTPTIFIPRSCNERMAELFVSTEVRPTAFVWLDPTTTHPRATHAHTHVIGFTRCTYIHAYTQEMEGLTRQMGLIHGAFWGRFVAEEDMGRVMAALAAVCFDRWQCSHVDAVVHVRSMGQRMRMSRQSTKRTN